jgi:hypothetical protein
MTTLALYCLWTAISLGAVALLLHLILNLPWDS